jgi:VWFA-related protein
MTTFSTSFTVAARSRSRTRRLSGPWGHFAGLTLSLLVLFLTAVLTLPAHAGVSLRIAEPISDPVTIRAEVTDENDNPVTNLTANDFQVTVDGNEITSGITFSQPALDDPSQRVSVVFVMDYSRSIVPTFEPAMVQATQNFIDAMQVGDFAGIVKFRGSGNSSLTPLREIRDDTVRTELKTKAAEDPLLLGETALLDAVEDALEAFEATLGTLPPGPKAIILVSDGVDNDSTTNRAQLADLANKLGLAIFSVGVGSVTDTVPNRDPPQTGEDILQSLADITGGTYQLAPPDDTGIQQIYTDVSESLLNGYVLEFDYGIAACQSYNVQVAAVTHGEGEQTVAASCPPPLTSDGGGGGAFGPLGLIAGLSLLALRRRLRVA